MKKTCGLVCGSSAVGILRQPLLSRMRPRASMNRHSLLTKWYVKSCIVNQALKFAPQESAYKFFQGAISFNLLHPSQSFLLLGLLLPFLCFLYIFYILRYRSKWKLFCIAKRGYSLFVFWFVWLLRWHLAHYLFSALFNCYVALSRTICFRVCLTVMLVSRALFVFWFL